MPRDGGGVYHRPVGTDAVADTTIESSKYNNNVADVEQDLNTPRPVIAGGTGSGTASGALTNLGGEFAKQVVTNYNSMVFQPGSFYSAATATGGPVAGHAFSGICYQTDANNMFLELRDQDEATQPGHNWIRQMKAGVWSAWASRDFDATTFSTVYVSDTPPVGVNPNSLWWESDTGLLFIRYNDGDSVQWVLAVPSPDTSLLVQKTGDTMTGPLVLPGNPTTALQAAPKQYVDLISTSMAVRYDTAQALTEAQQIQARNNIYASPLDALAYSGLQINGSMDLTQEYGVAGAVSTTNTARYICDHFQFTVAHASAAATLSQGPTTGLPFFKNAAIFQMTTAFTAPAANNYLILQTYVEGYRAAKLQWGTAQGIPLTVCFWVFSQNTAGVATLCVRNANSDRCYLANFTINNANTWEFKTVTIPPDTGGVWSASNAAGLIISWTFGVGSTYVGVNNTWNTGSAAFGTAAITAALGALNNQIALTGVGIFPGSFAPTQTQLPMIMRPLPDELLLCQRYYETTYDLNQRVGGTVNLPGFDHIALQSSANWAAGNQGHTYNFKAPKRITNCSMTAYDPNGGSGGNAYDYVGSVARPVTWAFVGMKAARWTVATVAVNTILSLGCHITADARF